MNPKYKEILKQFKKSGTNTESLLEHIVATTLNEDLMAKFKIPTNKRQLLRNFQCQYFKAIETNELERSTIQLYPRFPVKNTHHVDQRNYVRQCPKNAVKVFPKQRILMLISDRELRRRFAKIIEEILSETCDEFIEILHKCSIDCKTLPLPDEDGFVGLQPLKFLGKTENYSVFVRNRNRLKRKWQLHHTLVRNIIRECGRSLPDILFSLKSDKRESNNLVDLNEKFLKFVDNSAIIFHKLYEKILKLIEKKSNYNRDILEICTGILTVYLTKTLMNTISYIADCTGIDYLVPYIELNLIFDNGLTISPNIDDVVGLYSIFLHDLSQIADDFDRLGSTKKLRLSITDDFLDIQKQRIRDNITKFYEPILIYMKSLASEFTQIDNTKSTNFDNLSFDAGCELIENYHEYLNKTTTILTDNKYFKIGQLIVTKFIINLKQSIQNRIDEIFVYLSQLHQCENQLICDDFELIKTKLFEIPEYTNELITLGKYMIYIKTVYLLELRERIKELFKNLLRLIDYGDLTDEHTRLNATTISWLKDIETILEKSQINYEQLKAEAEERVFAKIHQVNQTLNDFYQELNCLNEMNDFDDIRNYMRQITVYHRKVRDISDDIEWINTEETILSYRKTNFEKFEKITTFLYPFTKLLKTCLTITRKLNVWLYGQFEFLNSTESEQFVETAVMEMVKFEKEYRELLRVQEADLRFDGFVDNPDLDKWPTPLKLIQIALDKLEDFQPYLRWLKIWCCDALTKQHWNEMSAIAGVDLTPNAGTTLQKLIDLNLEDIEKYEQIRDEAIKQQSNLEDIETYEQISDEAIEEQSNLEDIEASEQISDEAN